jgi:UDP-glucose 4,6-dehydratase
LCRYPEGIAYELGNNIEFIVHMAAETHVDNSISVGLCTS